MKVKIRGERSIETKLMRFACELREDARRVRTAKPVTLNWQIAQLASFNVPLGNEGYSDDRQTDGNLQCSRANYGGIRT